MEICWSGAAFRAGQCFALSSDRLGSSLGDRAFDQHSDGDSEPITFTDDKKRERVKKRKYEQQAFRRRQKRIHEQRRNETRSQVGRKAKARGVVARALPVPSAREDRLVAHAPVSTPQQPGLF